MNVLLALFYEFFKTGLFSVGGGLATLPFLYDIARRYDWMPIEIMPDMIAISESTPGPIGINMATYAGYNAAGIAGAVVATVALILPSLAIVILIAKFLSKFNENLLVESAFSGLHPAVAGLIAAAGWQIMLISLLTLEQFKLIGGILNLINLKAVALFVVAFILLRKKGGHPLYYIAGAAAVGILLRL